MKNLFLTILSVVALSLVSGCCGECAGIFKGAFNVSTEGRAYMDFARGGVRTRQFADSLGNRILGDYQDLQTSLENYTENCRQDGQCGQCCDEFQAEVIFLSFEAGAEGLLFNIAMRPDFLHNTPDTKPADEEDYLEVTSHNGLFARWFIPDPEVLASINIAGTRFVNVMAKRDETIIGKENVRAVYFTKNDGLVGFELGNGETFALVE